MKRHRARTIAGISGYSIATLFIMLILSVSWSNQQDSVGILKETGTHFIVYVPSSSVCCAPAGNTSGGSLIAEGGYSLMINNDVIATVKNIPGIRDAAPYLLYKLYDEKYNCDISFGGIDTSSIATKNNVCAATNIIAGSYFTGNADEIMAEEAFAMAHKLKVGDTLNIYESQLVVGGIVNSGIKPGKADLYAPIEHVRTILKENLNSFSDDFAMNIILVEVTDARIQGRVIAQLKNQMSYLSVSSYNCYQPAAEVMEIMHRTSTVLLAVVFLFLILFSSKTQFTGLMERYREIGILKSFGWSDAKLSAQMLSGSVIQSLAGSFIGVFLGITLILLFNGKGIKLFNQLDFALQPQMIFVIVILSVGGAILATIFPMIKLQRTMAGDMINNFN